MSKTGSSVSNDSTFINNRLVVFTKLRHLRKHKSKIRKVSQAKLDTYL